MSVGWMIRVPLVSTGKVARGIDIDRAGGHPCICDGCSWRALLSLGTDDCCRNARNSDDTLIKWFMKSRSISDRLPVGRLASKQVMESISVYRVSMR